MSIRIIDSNVWHNGRRWPRRCWSWHLVTGTSLTGPEPGHADVTGGDTWSHAGALAAIRRAGERAGVRGAS